jgi:hypothetical protein
VHDVIHFLIKFTTKASPPPEGACLFVKPVI